jgi:hypothetical protein
MMRAALLALALAIPTFAADPPKLSAKRETIDAPKDLAPAIRELIDNRATVVADTSGTVCTFWLRKEIPAAETKGGPTYRSIAPGTMVGVVQLARPWTDFRHQEAPAGVYTLRIVVQPETKDHEGTAPYRDFCILCPAAEDTKPDVLTLKAIVKKSGTATGGTHPVVMLLFPYPNPEELPAIRQYDKRAAIGIRGTLAIEKKTQELGFALTVVGKSTD